MWGERSRLERSWDVAEEDEIAGDAGSSEGVSETKEEDVKKVGGHGKKSEGSGGLVGVDSDKADEGFCTGDEEIVPDSVAGGGLPESCLQS